MPKNHGKAKSKKFRCSQVESEGKNINGNVRDILLCSDPGFLIRNVYILQKSKKQFDYVIPGIDNIDLNKSKERCDPISYEFPKTFDCNVLDNSIAFLLRVKNILPSCVEIIKNEKYVHAKFLTSKDLKEKHYAFYVNFDSVQDAKIISIAINVRNSGLLILLTLENIEKLEYYMAGTCENNVQKYQTDENFVCQEDNEDMDKRSDIKFIINHINKDEAEIELNTVAVNDEKPFEKSNISQTIGSQHNNEKPTLSKNQKKKQKKRRSLSESSCNEVDLCSPLDINQDFGQKCQLSTGGRNRSMSESCTDTKLVKGILKHTSRYELSTSESGLDFLQYETSEENVAENQCSSENCKRKVRFNDVVKKQLFRMDSSILGQRKKNQKKRYQKQRAMQRRNSEGDSADYVKAQTSTLEVVQIQSSTLKTVTQNNEKIPNNKSHNGGKAIKFNEKTKQF